jgi:hypothetical protein
MHASPRFAHRADCFVQPACTLPIAFETDTWTRVVKASGDKVD